MKLSEAIRLGAMLKPQGFSSFDRNSRSCALGAARDAGYHIIENSDGYGIEEDEDKVICPACKLHRSMGGLYYIIVHLNDAHRWTREEIADWVENIEAAQETPEPVQVCVQN